MSVQQQSIKAFTEAEYDQLTKEFGDNAVRTDCTFISVSVCLSVQLLCCLTCCLSAVVGINNYQARPVSSGRLHVQCLTSS